MKGVISAGHELTAKAGVEMLERGGNAFDAALAASFTSFVCEPALTSPGGGGFLMAHTGGGRRGGDGGETILYDFFADVPGRGKKRGLEGINFFSVNIYFAEAAQELYIGEGSAAVPGCIAGLEEVHRRHCRLELRDIMAPAIGHARRGVKVNSRQAYFNRILSPMLTASGESRRIYEPEGRPLEEGETLINRPLADALEYLSSKGLRRFYDGELARRILDGFGKRGLITEEDLRSYRVAVRRPLEVDYRGRKIFTNPPPSSGGALIAFSLKILEAFDLSGLGLNSHPYLKLLLDTMKVTNEARQRDFDRMVYNADMISTFLSEERIRSYRQRVAPPGAGSTTHISVVDGEGNAASITTSTGIGCGFMIPGTGIMMNNMLGEEDLNPRGFHKQPPGTRLSSMMAPTIVMRNEVPEIVLGSGGSKRIRNAILQVILNIIDHRMDVAGAVDAPRVHWDGACLQVEPGMEEAEVDGLKRDDIPVKVWKEKHMYFGGVNTVFVAPDGEIRGRGDPRRGGVCMKAEA